MFNQKQITMEYDFTFDKLPEAVAELSRKLNNIERLLQEQCHSPKRESDQLLTIQEAADFLSLSVPTLYGYVRKAAIPVSKRGNRLYFSKQELTEWVKGGRKKTAAEIKAEANTYIQSKKKKAPNDRV